MKTEFADVTDPSVMMPFRFNGSYRHLSKLHGQSGPRGVKRMMRERRHAEAQERNRRTPHDRTKAHRLGRCDKRACVLSTDAR